MERFDLLKQQITFNSNRSSIFLLKLYQLWSGITGQFITHNILESDSKMTKLSPDQVTSITSLLNDGKSTRKVAQIMGCCKTTVENYRKVMVTELPVPNSGRPRKLTSRDKRAIARSMVNGTVKTAVEMTKLINNEREDKVSSETVRRALKQEGLKAFKKKKPFLSKPTEEHVWNGRCITKIGRLMIGKGSFGQMRPK